jgi:hypothetical protein
MSLATPWVSYFHAINRSDSELWKRTVCDSFPLPHSQVCGLYSSIICKHLTLSLSAIRCHDFLQAGRDCASQDLLPGIAQCHRGRARVFTKGTTGMLKQNLFAVLLENGESCFQSSSVVVTLSISSGRRADALSCIPFLKGKNPRGKSSCRSGNPLYKGEELRMHLPLFPEYLLKTTSFAIHLCSHVLLKCRNTLMRNSSPAQGGRSSTK